MNETEKSYGEYRGFYTADNCPKQAKGMKKNIEYNINLKGKEGHFLGKNEYDESNDIVKISVYVASLKNAVDLNDFNKVLNGIIGVFLMETICVTNHYIRPEGVLYLDYYNEELPLCFIKTNDGFCQYNEILGLIDDTKEFIEDLKKFQKEKDKKIKNLKLI